MLARSPGPISTREMIAEVYCDEKLPWPVARNRIHVAICSLRDLGLRGTLKTVAEGYRLEGEVDVIGEPERTTSCAANLARSTRTICSRPIMSIPPGLARSPRSCE